MTRVLLADDSALMRDALAALLERRGLTVAGRYGTGDALLAAVASTAPDVVLLDVRMPPTFTDEGIRTAEVLAHRHPRVAVLVLSHYVEPNFALRVLETRTRGVGYLLKDHLADTDTLMCAISRVVGGGSFVDPAVVQQLIEARRRAERLACLTEREREILALMAEGLSNQAICARLFLSPKTVETHVRAIFRKFDLDAAPNDNRRVLAVVRYLKAA